MAPLALDDQAGIAAQLAPRLPSDARSFGAVVLAGLEFGWGVKAGDGLMALPGPGVARRPWTDGPA